MKTTLAIALVLLITYIGYRYYVNFRAKLEVNTSPREPMYTCDKHGVFRAAHLIEFLGDKWCPICFDEKLKHPLDSTVSWK